MGLTETVLEHVSVGRAILAVVVLLFVLSWLSRFIEHRKILRLGGYGDRRDSWAPFSVDLLWKFVQAARKHENLAYWFTQMGFSSSNSWTVESYILARRMVFTCDPDNVKAVLASQFSDFGKGEQFHKDWKDFLGDSIFTVDGPQWHSSRRLLRPSFTRDRVSDLHCFESHAQTLFRCIANGGPLSSADQTVDLSAANGKVVDMANLFFRYTLDITTEFLLDHDVRSLTTLKAPFAEAFDDVQRLQNIISRMGPLRPWMPKKQYYEGLKVINSFIDTYIQKALAMSPEELAKVTESQKGYTFLHEIASFTRDPVVLRDQIIAVLLAGRDTTAGTLSWALYELSKKPQYVARLRAEILETVGPDRMPTYTDLKDMTYLKNVLNETLRLYPAVPFNGREALRDTHLPRGGGPDGMQPIGVTAGTIVVYSPLVMQRRQDLYPPVSDKAPPADIFAPERWDHWFPRPHDYIPFNSGPRICIGQQFALTSMSFALCRLFQRYESITSHMDPIDGGVPLLKSDITISPGQGVWVSFQEAKTASQ